MSEASLEPNSSPHWYAVATRSRHEKVVAEQLWQKEVECFLPLHEVLSKITTTTRIDNDWRNWIELHA